MNIRKILRALAGGLYLLLGLLFVFSGLQNAHKLWRVATPNLHFLKTTGSVEEVVKHGNPDSEGASRGVPFVAEVKFSYSLNGSRFVSNTLSPSCTWCTPNEVFDAVGARPSQLAVGTRVPVFVQHDSPGVAYIQLSTGSDVRDEFAFTLLWLVIAPLFLYWHYGAWGRSEEESQQTVGKP